MMDIKDDEKAVGPAVAAPAAGPGGVPVSLYLPLSAPSLSGFPTVPPAWPADKRIIGVFNHKGGVGKSTSTVALGWKLASLGHHVLLVDADPQCNLTGFLVDPGYDVIAAGRGDMDRGKTVQGPRVNLSYDPLEIFYRERPHSNVRAALAPLLGSHELKNQLNLTDGNYDLLTEVFRVQDRNYMLPIIAGSNPPRRYGPFGDVPDSLYLLAGHIQLHEYEDAIHTATLSPSSSAQAPNIPGMFYHLFQSLIARHHFDYVLVDMSPSASVINRLIINSVHYLMVPCSCDYFSFMAIRSLPRLLFQCDTWKEQLRLQNSQFPASYPMPLHKPILLGHTFQLYTVHNGGPAQAFERWIAAINQEIVQRLVPALQCRGMTLPADVLETPLALIRNTQSAGAAAGKVHRPVWAMNDTLLYRGETTSIDQSLEIIAELQQRFTDMAQRITTRWNGLSLSQQQQIELTQRACQYLQKFGQLHNLENATPPVPIADLIRQAQDMHRLFERREL